MTPSLSQVLTQGDAAAAAIHPVYLLAGLAFFFLAAFSAVKGIAVYRRSRLVPMALSNVPSLSEIEEREKIEKFAFMTDELKSEKEKLAAQNSELQGKIQELNDSLHNIKKTRDVLERSNVALLKESDKLKAEKEGLLLRASQQLLGQEPLVKAKPPVKAKAKAKIEIKASKKKKEGRRPVRRVSRKVK